MDSRGRIYNAERASQLRDFSRLRYANNITPTDVDCLIEYGDRAYVIVEAKSNGAQVPMGQRLALQRIVRDFVLRGKEALLIIATHEQPSDQAIDFASCKVIEHFDGERWSTGNRGWKVRNFIDWWLVERELSEYMPAGRRTL